ncbi:hypothetical protein SEA_LILBEANIE_83 [Gordonia phage Lilbeanie]|uniref:Uncharacterized protein n=1 Tax=Gordonia phage Lilbeanie TaxID=2794947 RepID=A0A7T1KSC7_9CAUD|nr:hypothetical protein J1773_gp83 [Gordonia phage Lilbeanie]QPO17161.1 hypothetical protein SEA_LILBEANIE_83 [Gordonia phage Lilbeanie]
MSKLELAPWYHLRNPVATQRPPATGSGHQSSFLFPTLIINDDWRESVRGSGFIALAHTDGSGRTIISLADPTETEPDILVFLGHPNRLWIRPQFGALPSIGTWQLGEPWGPMNDMVSRGGRIEEEDVKR